MEYLPNRPFSFKGIIQLTYSIILDNFTKLLLLVLILIGPFNIVIAKYLGEFSLYKITIGSVKFNGIFDMGYSGIALSDLTTMEITISIIAVVLLEIVAIPLAAASIIILVKNFKEGKEIKLLQIIGQAFSRYLPLLWGTVSYFFFIVLILFFLGFVPLSLAMIEGFSQRILPIILLAILITPTIIYLLTRMSLYFAIIIFEKGSMGIKRSWQLVKGKFFRLLGLYLAIIAVDILVTLIFQLIFEYIFGTGYITIFLNKLFFMLLMIVNVVYYTVIYIDIEGIYV